jgi:hypothetical protein
MEMGIAVDSQGSSLWFKSVQFIHSFRPASYRPTFFNVPFRPNFGDIPAQVKKNNKMMVKC